MFADVTSANVVGYSGLELPATGLNIGPAFVSVSGEDIDLTEITVEGYDKEIGTVGQVYVQTRTGGGSTDKIYQWIDFVEEPDEEEEEVEEAEEPTHYYGWFTYPAMVPVKKGDVKFAPGEGLWSTSTAKYRFQSSGEVETKEDIAINLPATGLTIANPTPVKVDLNKCYVDGYNKEIGTVSQIFVQTLTGGGSTDKIYQWIDFVEEPDEEEEEEEAEEPTHYIGWFTYPAMAPVADNTVTVEAGGGWWTTSTAKYDFVWPKVNLSK